MGKPATIPRWVMAALGSLGVAACGVVGLGDGGRAELERNRIRWVQTRPESYSYAIQMQCFCGPDVLRSVRVRVVGQDAIQRSYVDTGDPVPQSVAESFPTVDGLFDLIHDAYDRDAHEVRVAYDPDSGVPLDIWIDYEENTIDEELGYEVVEAVAPLAIP